MGTCDKVAHLYSFPFRLVGELRKVCVLFGGMSKPFGVMSEAGAEGWGRIVQIFLQFVDEPSIQRSTDLSLYGRKNSQTPLR